MVYKMMHFTIKLTAVLLLLLLGACTRMVTVDINAIVDPALAQVKKDHASYFLTPAQNINKDDLYFKEYSGYFIKALKQHGYSLSADKSKASIEIVFSYGLSDGHSGVYTYASPIYEFVGGETITITEQTSDPAVQPKVTTIHIPSRYERVGTSLESQEYTYYIAHAGLEARTISSSPGDKVKILWGIQMQSRVTSDDLRRIMPYMAYAATPYIGKNSGHQISVDIKENDPKVINTKSFKHN